MRLAGVQARSSFGHPSEHMAYEVHGGSDSVMIIGDCIGNDHVAFERPSWISGSDQDGNTAITTRLSLLDQLTTQKTRVIGYHLKWWHWICR